MAKLSIKLEKRLHLTISSTDVESNPKDLLDDTATQQNTDVSVNKVTNNISNTQEIDEEFNHNFDAFFRYCNQFLFLILNS